ncbi:Epoxide hydrolase [Mycolicibacterium fortuitum]|jgi:pimeloyl-ACP methyl ester carboxylesterase|uniref:Alpha/beta hydrolase fold protein n=4 Tax=Mycolicibacterium fortuitum TaxID=1766 RepID=A0A0N9Y6U2_MYCFO|nr:Epoxide hydrolase [Mycobacterium sp. VKM Ac-1817D]ALI26968.1 Epoxide hydrolase [Mycolicibacterium fortuitum]EJZ11217.1 alpha/beta hydrolase [Mycolicibacterium fortuitum subsp. fortuitum DSM 46621 = ATCC 6841 = JCM 6387]CRL79484.1 alpha/beta hydrolase [Mycolicibacter nonchromogenicus]BDD98960.1 alpha/beta hydrolase [Mycolicibacterium fortuitum subsp. fortuitum]GAT05371.1 alpha/beta hydrolase fold protein [Mycolicibacterium fortuitum subsp. acetamidolyticum]
MMLNMDQYRRGEFVFDVIDSGPADGPVVVLLHGFPQQNVSWEQIIPLLTAKGYRCLAPNQRGYSPGARPPRRRDYRAKELVRDVLALIDADGADRVHLVGHDWGAAVAWSVAAYAPERLASLSALSVPHPLAFLRSLLTSRQGLASWYMYVNQLPWVPERLMLGRDGRGKAIAKSLIRSGLPPEAARRDALAMVEPGSLTAALNWYRAMPLSRSGLGSADKITVPTLYVWSDKDIALTAKPARDTANYVSGPYRFETINGASHWLPEEKPAEIAEMLLQWFAAHPI